MMVCDVGWLLLASSQYKGYTRCDPLSHARTVFCVSRDRLTSVSMHRFLGCVCRYSEVNLAACHHVFSLRRQISEVIAQGSVLKYVKQTAVHNGETREFTDSGLYCSLQMFCIITSNTILRYYLLHRARFGGFWQIRFSGKLQYTGQTGAMAVVVHLQEQWPKPAFASRPLPGSKGQANQTVSCPQACGYIGSRCCVGLCVVFYVYCLCLDAAGGDGGHQHSAWSGSKIISVDNELMVIWCVTCTVWAYTLSSMVGVFIDPQKTRRSANAGYTALRV